MPYDKKKITSYKEQTTHCKRKPEEEVSNRFGNDSATNIVTDTVWTNMGFFLKKSNTINSLEEERSGANKCRQKIANISQVLYDEVAGEERNSNKKVMPEY